MSATPATLTVVLLEELRRRWERAAAPIVGSLRPGLTDVEIDDATAPLGLRVPHEARVWWSWHDGSDGFAEMTGARFAHLPLTRAVAEAAEQRERAERISGDQGDPMLWRGSWLPLSTDVHGGVITVDGQADVDAEWTNIYYTEPEIGAQDPPIRARSLGEMVTWWIEAFDAGAYEYSQERKRWLYWPERLDPERERTRVV